MNRKQWSAFGILLLFAVGLVVVSAQPVFAHCQIPCGIYDHKARVKELHEHATTIEKSVTLINELAGKTDVQSQNQLVRWVMNKEKHAQKIQDMVSEYFLAQVVKPVAPLDQKAYQEYLQKLADHHSVIVLAMKAKQSADMKDVEALHKAVDKLGTYYE